MHEDFRMLKSELKDGKYIFVCRVPAKDATHAELTKHMRKLLHRAQLFKAEASDNEL